MDFPISPTENEIHSIGAKKWVYRNERWEGFPNGKSAKFLVTDFGVRNDGDTSFANQNLHSLRQLVMNVGESGGGSIVFPPGHYYLEPDPDGMGCQIQWNGMNFHFEAGSIVELYDPNMYMRAQGYRQMGMFHVGGAIDGYNHWAQVAYNQILYGDWNYGLTDDPHRPMPPILTQPVSLGTLELHVDFIPEQIQPLTWVELRSSEWEQDDHFGQNTLRTELVKVRDVNRDSNIIYLSTDVLSDYTIEEYTVKVVPLKLIDNISFTGSGTIRGLPLSPLDEIPSNGSGENGIYMRGVNRAYVNGLRFERWQNCATRVQTGINISVSNCSYSAFRLPDNFTGAGQGTETYGGFYGISFTGTQYVQVDNVYGENLRHLVDTGTTTGMTRQAIFTNLLGQSSYAAVLSTHSVVDCIMSNIIVRDSHGGLVFRGANLIASNLDIEGTDRVADPVGGIQVGIWRGGDDGLGDPLAVSHSFGSISIENVRIRKCANPLNLFGAVDYFSLENAQVEMPRGDTSNLFSIFSRRIDHLRIRNCVFDVTNQPEDYWGGAIDFRGWSATTAERGVIDIQDNLVINPSAYAIAIVGVMDEDAPKKGDYIISNNRFMFTGVKEFRPYAYIRFSEGYFGNISADRNVLIGASRYASNLLQFDGPVPLEHLASLPSSKDEVSERSARGKTFVHGNSIPEGNLTFSRSMVLQPSSSGLGIVDKKVVTEAGTTGFIKIIGSMEKGSDIISVSEWVVGSLKVGQYLEIPKAGNAQGLSSLTSFVRDFGEDYIRIADNSSGSTGGDVEILYAVPRIASTTTPGMINVGTGSPFGKELAPTGALYVQTDYKFGEDSYTWWQQQRYEDVNGWRPLFSPDENKIRRDSWSRSLVPIIEGVYKDADNSQYSREVVMSQLGNFSEVSSSRFDPIVLPISGGEGEIVTLKNDGTFGEFSFSRTSDKSFVGADGIGFADSNYLTVKPYPVTVHGSLSDTPGQPEFPNMMGAILQGNYTNLFPISTVDSFIPFNASVTESVIDNPFDPSLGKFFWFQDNSTEAEHSIRYEFPPTGQTGFGNFSVYVYVDGPVLDRLVRLDFRNEDGTYSTSVIDFSGESPKPTTGSTGLSLVEKITSNIFRLHCTNTLTPGDVATITTIRTADMDGEYIYPGDGISRFAFWGPQYTLSRGGISYIPPGSSTSVETISYPEFDLSKETVAFDYSPNFTGPDTCLLKVGDLEFRMNTHRGYYWENSEGIYLKDTANDVIPEIEVDKYFGQYPMLRAGKRLAISYVDGIVRVAEEGIVRIEYYPEGPISTTGLTIGGDVNQNFILGGLVVIPQALHGYDLLAVSTKFKAKIPEQLKAPIVHNPEGYKLELLDEEYGNGIIGTQPIMLYTREYSPSPYDKEYGVLVKEGNLPKNITRVQASHSKLTEGFTILQVNGQTGDWENYDNVYNREIKIQGIPHTFFNPSSNVMLVLRTEEFPALVRDYFGWSMSQTEVEYENSPEFRDGWELRLSNLKNAVPALGVEDVDEIDTYWGVSSMIPGATNWYNSLQTYPYIYSNERFGVGNIAPIAVQKDYAFAHFSVLKKVNENTATLLIEIIGADNKDVLINGLIFRMNVIGYYIEEINESHPFFELENESLVSIEIL